MASNLEDQIKACYVERDEQLIAEARQETEAYLEATTEAELSAMLAEAA